MIRRSFIVVASLLGAARYSAGYLPGGFGEPAMGGSLTITLS